MNKSNPANKRKASQLVEDASADRRKRPVVLPNEALQPNLPLPNESVAEPTRPAKSTWDVVQKRKLLDAQIHKRPPLKDPKGTIGRNVFYISQKTNLVALFKRVERHLVLDGG